MFRTFLLDAGFTKSRLGLWLGIWGMGFSIAGSVAGGLLARKIPIWNAVFICAVLRIFPLAGEWWLSTLGSLPESSVLSIICSEHFFGGMLTTAMFAWMMSRIDPRIGGSHFTALATIEVFGKAPSSWLSGLIADRGGYSLVFGAGTVLSAVFLLVLPFAKSDDAESR
jgi:predicted MFS family arabinose efflux permease